MVVAFWVPHNEGIVQGIFDQPGQDTGLDLIDLYEVDATIKTFASRAEAQEWLDNKAAEYDN